MRNYLITYTWPEKYRGTYLISAEDGIEASDKLSSFLKEKYGPTDSSNSIVTEVIGNNIQIMSQHNYTIEELEDIVFNRSRCYEDSEAFQSCLEYVRKTNYPMYKDMLYKEAIACGGIN